jgi:hypothetical protein
VNLARVNLKSARKLRHRPFLTKRCYRHLRFELRIIGTSPTRGNDVAETALVGWGGRIRTWECSLQEHSSSLLLAPRSSAQSPEVAEIAALLSRRPISRAASMFDTGAPWLCLSPRPPLEWQASARLLARSR